jgi:hypothetical protein
MKVQRRLHRNTIPQTFASPWSGCTGLLKTEYATAIQEARYILKVPKHEIFDGGFFA